MYCPQCGTENNNNQHFCGNCGGVLNPGKNPSNQTHVRNPPVLRTSLSKAGKPIKIILVVVAILFIAFMGWIALSDDDTTDTGMSSELADSAESKSDLDQEAIEPDKATEPHESTDENPSDNNNAEQKTIDELASLVQQSQSATVELVRNPDSKQSLNTDPDEAIAIFKSQDFERLKQDFISANFQPIDYPFHFIPEYRLIFDTGVSYTIMQDEDGENRMSVLKFDGNSSLWYAPFEVYSQTNVIRTTLMDDFSNMHIFCTADDESTAMNKVLNHGLVQSFILGYYCSLGFGFEGEGIYLVDDLVMGQMPETDPNLYWALIQYSVKPSTTGNLPENMSIYMEDDWIKGGFMLAAIWNDMKSAGARSYLLGITPFEYDVNGTSEAEAALSLYEQSYVKKLIK